MKSEEQKYWMEHYPHEAETIITLCDLFDEAQDEATKAQINYAIGVLRKKEKYRRYDLRKNPEDLPRMILDELFSEDTQKYLDNTTFESPAERWAFRSGMNYVGLLLAAKCFEFSNVTVNKSEEEDNE